MMNRFNRCCCVGSDCPPFEPVDFTDLFSDASSLSNYVNVASSIVIDAGYGHIRNTVFSAATFTYQWDFYQAATSFTQGLAARWTTELEFPNLTSSRYEIRGWGLGTQVGDGLQVTPWTANASWLVHLSLGPNPAIDVYIPFSEMAYYGTLGNSTNHTIKIVTTQTSPLGGGHPGQPFYEEWALVSIDIFVHSGTTGQDYLIGNVVNECDFRCRRTDPSNYRSELVYTLGTQYTRATRLAFKLEQIQAGF